jgi:hypothetical protein
MKPEPWIAAAPLSLAVREFRPRSVRQRRTWKGSGRRELLADSEDA